MFFRALRYSFIHSFIHSFILFIQHQKSKIANNLYLHPGFAHDLSQYKRKNPRLCGAAGEFTSMV